jgi:flagellin
MHTTKANKSMERLSSGSRINRAADDAAGLAVSEKMKSQLAGMEQSLNNINDGISMIQTYDGALSSTHTILSRMKTLASQSANGTYTDVERAAIQLEYDELRKELTDIAAGDFNGQVLLNERENPENYPYAFSGVFGGKAFKIFAENHNLEFTFSGGSGKDMLTITNTLTGKSSSFSDMITQGGYNAWLATSQMIEDFGKINFYIKDGAFNSGFSSFSVSASDFNKSSDIMGKDNLLSGLSEIRDLLIQAGARSKDGKRFDFNYTRVFNAMSKAEGREITVEDSIGSLAADFDASAAGLGLDDIDLTSAESANAALDKIDNAVNKVLLIRGTLGSVQNRLEHKYNNLSVTIENLTTAESRIRDTDYAKEIMTFTREATLQEVSATMMGQVMEIQRGILDLLA